MIKKPNRRYMITDALRQNCGKAVRLSYRVFSKEYISDILSEENSHTVLGRGLFLERNPEFNKYLVVRYRLY